MNQPILRTSRLILSPFEEKDLSDIFAYASHPEISKSVMWSSHMTLDDSKFYLDWITQNFSNHHGKIFFVWAIRRIEDGRAIGSIDFKQPTPQSAQFDYALAVQEWNKGIITEAAQAVIKWAFQEIPTLEKFQAFCVVDNLGSRKVMEKCGMRLESVRSKSMTSKGQVIDTAHYEIKRDFEKPLNDQLKF